MNIKDWEIYSYELFSDQLKRLIAEVHSLKIQDQEGYKSHPKAKFLAAVLKLTKDSIPNNPSDPIFRQGNTLGKQNKHWFRAKFFKRYRLFFRYSTQHKVIIYVWLNDEKTLRKADSSTDPYFVFSSMLRKGNPPQDFDQLLKISVDFKEVLGNDEELGF
jgi:toxin YhaV